MNNLGTFLKKLREEKKLTQDELANKLFIDRTTITKLENNHRNPTTEQLIQYSEFFEISVSEILNKKRIIKIQESDNLLITLIKEIDSKNKKMIILTIVMIVMAIIAISYLIFAPKYYEINLIDNNSNIKELSGYFIEDSSNYTYYINVELVNPESSIWSGLYTKEDNKYNVIEGYTKGITEEGYYKTNRTFYDKVNKYNDTIGKQIIKNKESLYLCFSKEYQEEMKENECFQIKLKRKS